MWFVIILVAAVLIIWILVLVNHKIFNLLGRKQKGIHLAFFERLNKVIIVIAIALIAIAAFDENTSVWHTMIGSTAVISAVVAFAAQDVIKDILAGLMISLHRPFEIGDRIELADGTVGVVEDMTNRHVVLVGLDTLRYAT